MLEVLKFIYKNLDQFRTRFVVVFLAGIIYGSFSFAIGLTLSEFTKANFTLDRFYLLVPILIFVYFGYLFFAWIIRKYGEALGPQFENYLRFKYFRRLEELSVERITKIHSGYILSLVNRIGTSLNAILFNTFWSLSSILAHVSLFFVFIARESITLAFLNIGILVAFTAISTWLAQKMVVLNRELSLKNASLLESYADFITNLLTIKKLAIYVFAEKKLTEKTQENYDQIYEVQSFHAKRWLFLHSLYAVAYMGTIIFFLYSIATGRQSLAILILFMSAYGAIRFHMERLSESLKNIMETKAYISTVEDLLAGGRAVSGNSAAPAWETISLTDVEFIYQGNKKKITIPKFKLSRGEKVLVQGPSGQGKTTLLNLLINSFSPPKGNRTVNGIGFDELPRSFFDNNMVMISQEVELFNLSLWENITLGQKFSESEVRRILEDLDLWTWVSHLQQGLKTVVGEKGVRLSAGQKQRVNLMRGLLLERDIYLLDEPTSHLDVATEQKIVDFLQRRLADKTAVIVTHRPSLQQLCDRSYAFKNHALAESP